MAKVVNIKNPHMIVDVPDYLVGDYIATKEWLAYKEELEQPQTLEKTQKKNSKVEEKSE